MKKTNDAKATLPLTVQEAAELWEMHPSRVKQLCQQGRVKHTKKGGGEKRAGAILIQQLEKPERITPGTLKKKAVG